MTLGGLGLCLRAGIGQGCLFSSARISADLKLRDQHDDILVQSALQAFGDFLIRISAKFWREHRGVHLHGISPPIDDRLLDLRFVDKAFLYHCIDDPLAIGLARNLRQGNAKRNGQQNKGQTDANAFSKAMFRRARIAKAIEPRHQGGGERNGQKVGHIEQQCAAKNGHVEGCKAVSNHGQGRHQSGSNRNAHNGSFAPADHRIRACERREQCHQQIKQIGPCSGSNLVCHSLQRRKPNDGRAKEHRDHSADEYGPCAQP